MPLKDACAKGLLNGKANWYFVVLFQCGVSTTRNPETILPSHLISLRRIFVAGVHHAHLQTQK